MWGCRKKILWGSYFICPFTVFGKRILSEDPNNHISTIKIFQNQTKKCVSNMPPHTKNVFIFIYIFIKLNIHTINTHTFQSLSCVWFSGARHMRGCTKRHAKSESSPPFIHLKTDRKTSLNSRPLPIPNLYPTLIPNPRKTYMRQILLIN